MEIPFWIFRTIITTTLVGLVVWTMYIRAKQLKVERERDMYRELYNDLRAHTSAEIIARSDAARNIIRDAYR